MPAGREANLLLPFDFCVLYHDVVITTTKFTPLALQLPCSCLIDLGCPF